MCTPNPCPQLPADTGGERLVPPKCPHPLLPLAYSPPPLHHPSISWVLVDDVTCVQPSSMFSKSGRADTHVPDGDRPHAWPAMCRTTHMPRAQDRHASTHCRPNFTFLSLSLSLLNCPFFIALSPSLSLSSVSLSLSLSLFLFIILFPSPGLFVALFSSLALSLSLPRSSFVLLCSLICSLSGDELFETQTAPLGRSFSLSGLSFFLSLP